MIDIRVYIKDEYTNKVQFHSIYTEYDRVDDDSFKFLREFKKDMLTDLEGNGLRILKVRYKRFSENNDNLLEKNDRNYDKF